MIWGWKGDHRSREVRNGAVEVKVERKVEEGKKGSWKRKAKRVLDKLLNFWRRSCDSRQIFVGHAVSGPVTTGNQLTRVCELMVRLPSACAAP
jgi:hypothetical protein